MKQHDRTTGDGPTPLPEAARKKAYQRPAVRVLGAVHLLTRGNGVTTNGDGGQMMRMTSDRLLKQDIVRIGDHPLGIGLYLFTYKPGYGAGTPATRHFGVMADEVEAVMPHAVSVHTDGFKVVNYAMLGITPAGQ